MPDIFLSYNREDLPKAKLIAKALADAGFDVWWDTVLRAGQTYDEVTERQLHAAKAVVVLWSSRSVRSKWVRAEATLGDRKSALIPVMIEPCDRPIMFELIQTADLVGWEGDTTTPAWQAFVADVREHVERKVAAAKPAPAADSAPAEPAKAAPAGGAETIEAAFWMSIQDGDDVEEFESYLERYPQGHFASLAKKRIAALTAAKAPPATPPVVPVPPPVAAAPPPPKIEPALAQPQPRAAPQPSPQPAPRVDAFQRQAATAPARKKGGSPLPLILGAIAVIAVVGGAAFAFMPKTPASDAPVETAAVAAEPPPATPAVPEVQPAAVTAAADNPPAPAPAKTYRDCEDCPEMMRLPGGTFTMGSPPSETGHRSWEGPQREVTLAPFAVGLKEVTLAQWDACVAGGGCGNYTPTDKGWGRGARPAIMVSWNDAQAYVKWLSGKTGKTYRLPTEAEWEYAARGGTSTAYWWGDKYVSDNVPHGKTDETGAHEANGFGLFDVTGNVAEWVQDCYVNSYASAPTDGSAVATSNCQRVIRGGGWKANAGDLRIANRSRLSPSTRDTAIGFRVVATE